MSLQYSSKLLYDKICLEPGPGRNLARPELNIQSERSSDRSSATITVQLSTLWRHNNVTSLFRQKSGGHLKAVRSVSWGLTESLLIGLQARNREDLILFTMTSETGSLASKVPQKMPSAEEHLGSPEVKYGLKVVHTFPDQSLRFNQEKLGGVQIPDVSQLEINCKIWGRNTWWDWYYGRYGAFF